MPERGRGSENQHDVVNDHSLHKLHCGGVFRNPLRFLRWTGLLNYRPIPFADFNPVSFPTPPIFSGPTPPALDGQPWTASQASGDVMNHVVTVDKGLATCYGYVFDRRGRLIAGASHKHREGRRYPEWITRREHIQPHGLFPSLRTCADNIVVLTASTQRLYFHWLLDVLPRMAMVDGHIRNGGRLLVENRQRFQSETLDLLGVASRQIIDGAKVPALTAPKLIVPCHQIMKGREFPAWALTFIRERFLPLSGPHPLPGATKIYISRQGTPTRKPTNEDDIIARLEARGFAVVELEKMTLPEQISLFRDARVVLAPHGGGLANLVFCAPGTRVIELFPAANIDLYYRLAAAMGLNYFFAKGTDGDPRQLTPANYHIAWETIEKTLQLAEIC